MILLEWPSTYDCKGKVEDYEQAYLKAALEGSPNGDSFNTYEKMFGEKPKIGTPYWLVRLAIYYGGIKIGHERCKRPFKGIEADMFRCVSQLDEQKLRNDARLWHHMWLHDVEDVKHCGREKVSE